jgi:peptidyl-prolyl cis-trans isomerase A (cyclophilin A)
MRFAPIGRVVEGMDVVDRLHAGYGEGAPRGPGPDQAQIRSQGNAYLTQNFPDLDYIERATIVQ